jgi:hypothetical protein
MSLFQLFKGRLILPKEIFYEEDLVEVGDNWMAYVYAKFPLLAPSMKIIEGYLDSQPILRWLSGEPLPLTERPLLYRTSDSIISGKIVGDRRQVLNSTSSWLSTDDIQFLFVLFLWNQDASTCFHVLGPAIMNRVHIAYMIMEKTEKEN